MAIKKEKIIIIIEIILLVVIFLSSVIIQISDSKLQGHDTVLRVKQLELIQYTSKINYLENKILEIKLNQIAMGVGGEYIPNLDINPTTSDSKRLLEEFKNGSISTSQYLYRSVDVISNESDNLAEIHNQKNEELMELFETPPAFFSISYMQIKEWSVKLQFIAIISVFILYFQLYRKIGRNHLTKIENKLKKCNEENQNLKNQINKLKNNS